MIGKQMTFKMRTLEMQKIKHLRAHIIPIHI